MKPLRIVFLDFTGTIDFYDPVKEDSFKSKLFIPKVKRRVENFHEEVNGNMKILRPWKSEEKNKRYLLLPDHTGHVTPKEEIDENRSKFNDYYDDDYYFGKHDDVYLGYHKYSSPSFGYDSPNKKAIEYLKKLLDLTGAKIVYSCLRRYSGWEACANFVGLSHKYSLGGEMGVTPEVKTSWFSKDNFFFDDEDKTIVTSKTKEGTEVMSYKERQNEIEEWFKKWANKINVQNYVILDDDPITDTNMKKYWVSSVAQNGFLKKEYDQALKILLAR